MLVHSFVSQRPLMKDHARLNRKILLDCYACRVRLRCGANRSTEGEKLTDATGGCGGIETSSFLDASRSYCSRMNFQSSFSSVMLAWLSKLVSGLSAPSGGAVKLDGVAGLLAAAELLSLS